MTCENFSIRNDAKYLAVYIICVSTNAFIDVCKVSYRGWTVIFSSITLFATRNRHFCIRNRLGPVIQATIVSIIICSATFFLQTRNNI